jgi:hypothetical protein
MCRNSNAGDLEFARRMRALGVRIDLGAFEKDLVILQDGGPPVNSIASCYLTSSHIGSILTSYVKLMANGSVPFGVCGFELFFPWKDTPINLLPDPADPSAPEIYKFGQYNGSRYDKSQVIFQRNKTLRRGQPMEGYLLAIDFDPVPAEIQHGSDVTAKLTILDQYDRPHSSGLVLWVDRSVEYGPKPRAPKPRKRLFDQPDGIFRNVPGKPEGVVIGGDHYSEISGLGR